MITDFRGLIPQRIRDWDGYDLETIKQFLERAGTEVRIIGAHELDLSAIRDREKVAALYASSQAPRYKQYLQDIVANLHFGGILVIPAFQHMLAHEDKAFQAMKLAATDITAPRSYVFGDKRHAYEFLRTATFPLVGKSVDGYGSRGVCLLPDIRAGKKFVDRHMYHSVFRKGRPCWLRIFQRLVKPAPSVGILLFQDLVPNIEGDWKILIWGDTACGLYRTPRPKDFRASGSGRFSFIDVPVAVLDFAREALDKLDLPWASLDIGYDGTRCHLLEYQAMHFGLTTAEKGLFYYVRDCDGIWEKRAGRIQIETEMARIVVDILRRAMWL